MWFRDMNCMASVTQLKNVSVRTGTQVCPTLKPMPSLLLFAVSELEKEWTLQATHRDHTSHHSI